MLRYETDSENSDTNVVNLNDKDSVHNQSTASYKSLGVIKKTSNKKAISIKNMDPDDSQESDTEVVGGEIRKRSSLNSSKNSIGSVKILKRYGGGLQSSKMDSSIEEDNLS